MLTRGLAYSSLRQKELDIRITISLYHQTQDCQHSNLDALLIDVTLSYPHTLTQVLQASPSANGLFFAAQSGGVYPFHDSFPPSPTSSESHALCGCGLEGQVWLVRGCGDDVQSTQDLNRGVRGFWNICLLERSIPNEVLPSREAVEGLPHNFGQGRRSEV